VGGALAAKVIVPREPQAVVARPRLFARLDVAVGSPLTLLVAGAGAGKTVLLCTWARSGRAPGPVAWVSLDAADNDRRRFWVLVSRALQAAGVGEPVASLEVPARAGVDGYVPALLAALAERERPVVLVLDDFHEVSAAVSPALEDLVRRPVQGLRLVLASRVDPPVRLGRLTVAGEVTQLHAAELAFTAGETGTVLESAGARLGGEGVRRLWAKTEGWPAAIKLAAVSLRSRADQAVFLDEFTGEHVAVNDYLVSEVLSRQPAEVREFLLRTSVVDTLDGELADALSGRSGGGQATLAGLEHSGVPVAAIDDRAHWYRYHGLFAEFLRARLGLEQPEQVAALHNRAAEVLAARGDDAMALWHAVAGRAWPLAARLVAEQGVAMILGGRIEAVAPLAGALPPEQQDRHPELALALAALLLERGDRAAAETCLTRALAAEARGVGDRRGSFQRMVVLVKLQLARLDLDLPLTISLAEELLESDDQRNESADPELRAFALANAGIAALWMGDLGIAVRTLKRALAAARHGESDWPALVAASHLALMVDFVGDVGHKPRRANQAIAIAQRRGWMNTWPVVPALQTCALAAIQRLDLDEAERQLQQAKRALGRGRRSLYSLVGGSLRSAMLEARGELEDALDEARATREGARQRGGHPYLADVQPLEARLLISLGRLESAREVLGPPDARAATAGILIEHAHLHLAQGDPAAARATLAPALQDNHRQMAHIPAMGWVVEALAHDAQHDPFGADQALARAIDILGPGAAARPLVVYGLELRPLLQRQLEQGTDYRELVERALAVLDAHSDARSAGNGRLDLLTERELEVLRYLPTMLSAREIAAELIVSPNTVRSHLKAIYSKLGSHRRSEAVQRARELQLLDR